MSIMIKIPKVLHNQRSFIEKKKFFETLKFAKVCVLSTIVKFGKKNSFKRITNILSPLSEITVSVCNIITV